MRQLVFVGALVCLVGALACDPSARVTNSTPDASARATVAPASPQGCGGECSAIFREAVAWVAKTRSVAPARLLLDTLESGRLSYTGPHVVPRSLLTDLTVSTGVGGRGTVDTMAQCFGSPFRPVPESCQPLADKIMVTCMRPFWTIVIRN